MKLIEVFPNWAQNGGIFKVLTDTKDVPWKSEIDGNSLDIQYYGNHSGSKSISMLLTRLLNDGALSYTSLSTISDILWDMYSVQWTKLYNTLSLQYDPIKNYDMTETATENGTNTGTVATAASNNYGSTIEVVNNGTTSTDSGVYGFNSNNAVNSDTSEATSTDRSNQTHGGTDTNSVNRTDDLHNTRESTLTRSGNIGVTTSQQMIESERALWKYTFFNQVFEDVDSILTLKIYSMEV